jgi:hypothetical protein
MQGSMAISGESQTAEILECGPDWELNGPVVMLWAMLADLLQKCFQFFETGTTGNCFGLT